MKKALMSLAGMSLILAACAAPPSRVGSAYQAIEAELKQASQEKPRAASPEAVEKALLPPLTVEMPKLKAQPLEPRFDLVVNNAPAKEVFMAIVSGTRYSMLVSPEVKENISVNLKDVTVFEALDAIRELYGYDYKLRGNRIFVLPAALQTRVFQVNYLMGQRKGRSDLRVTSGSITSTATPQTAPGASAPGAPTSQALESSRITTTFDNDFWTEVTNSLKAIVGTEGGRSVVVNPDSGVIVVRAYPNELRHVEDYLKATQLVVERQVMLEAKIIQVDLNDSFQAGINWAAFKTGNNSRFAGGVITPGTTLGPDGTLSTTVGRNPDGSVPQTPDLTANPASPGALQAAAGVPGGLLGLAFQTSSFAALLDFLETQGTVHVLSAPRIAAINNQKAVLKVGTDEFFVTNITTNTTTTGTSTTVAPTITVQPFFSGIALDVTPQIDQDNYITLHIHPSVSQVFDKTKNIDLGQLGTFRLPLASSNISESDTVVRVPNGNIVAIGGLMKQQSSDGRSQVPGLGDVPVLGNLFRNTNRSNLKSELVILLKPTVIESPQNWQQDILETEERMRSFAPHPPSQRGSDGLGKQ